MLEESKCWKVSGVRKAEDFFRAVSLLVPDATHMFLEGSPDPDIEALLAAAADDADYAAPVGTIWSYRGQEALVQWFDAFLEPLLVSKSVARERVEEFASAVGGAVSEASGSQRERA
jgi:hypothetical protein